MYMEHMPHVDNFQGFGMKTSERLVRYMQYYSRLNVGDDRDVEISPQILSRSDIEGIADLAAAGHSFVNTYEGEDVQSIVVLQ